MFLQRDVSSAREIVSSTHHQILTCNTFRESSFDDRVHEDDFGQFDGEIVLVPVATSSVLPNAVKEGTTNVAASC